MEIPKAGWTDRILFLLGRRKAFRVEGNSMSPAIGEGDVVLVKPTRRVKTGDVVVARHPFKQSVKLLKRVSEIDAQGRLILKGDNPAESTDSRSFGSISPSDIIARVVARLK